MFFTAILVLAATLTMVLSLPVLALLLGAGTDAVWQALGDTEVMGAIALSLGAASLALFWACLLGIPLGYVLARKKWPGQHLVAILVDLPVIIPHPVIGIGLMWALGRDGILGAALAGGFDLHFVSALPGVVLAMLVVSAPYVVKAARDGFLRVGQGPMAVARSLGGSPFFVFRTVALPMALPTIGSGMVLAWARAISEFGSIAILAYYPKTAPVVIWDRFMGYGLEAAMGPALVLLCLCALCFFLLRLVRQRLLPAVEGI